MTAQTSYSWLKVSQTLGNVPFYSLKGHLDGNFAIIPRNNPWYWEAPNDVQWASGEAFCIGCNHRWVAAVPVGVPNFDCPACQREMGRWKFGFAPDDGQMVRQCNCGNQLFYLTPDGHLCANCGIYQRY